MYTTATVVQVEYTSAPQNSVFTRYCIYVRLHLVVRDSVKWAAAAPCSNHDHERSGKTWSKRACMDISLRHRGADRKAPNLGMTRLHRKVIGDAHFLPCGTTQAIPHLIRKRDIVLATYPIITVSTSRAAILLRMSGPGAVFHSHYAVNSRSILLAITRLPTSFKMAISASVLPPVFSHGSRRERPHSSTNDLRSIQTVMSPASVGQSMIKMRRLS